MDTAPDDDRPRYRHNVVNFVIGKGDRPDLHPDAQNVIIGHGSGLNLTTGSRNIIIGANEGNHLTTECLRLVMGGVVDRGMTPSEYVEMRGATINALGHREPPHQTPDGHAKPDAVIHTTRLNEEPTKPV